MDNAVSPRTWITITLLAAVIAATGSYIVKTVLTPGSIPPIGTIVAFSGAVEDIPRGWVPCDGLAVLPNGERVPDLTGRFLMGTMAAGLEPAGEAEHAHQWVRRGSGDQVGEWYSYTDVAGPEQEVDTWTPQGRGLDGTGGNHTYPFISAPGSTLYTSRESNLPPHVAVRYIIRVR